MRRTLFDCEFWERPALKDQRHLVSVLFSFFLLFFPHPGLFLPVHVCFVLFGTHVGGGVRRGRVFLLENAIGGGSLGHVILLSRASGARLDSETVPAVGFGRPLGRACLLSAGLSSKVDSYFFFSFLLASTKPLPHTSRPGCVLPT